MPNEIECVQDELNSLGYSTRVKDTPQGQAVVFLYTIESGPHEGKDVLVGLSFQETGYPEYPPHWIHVCPPMNDHKGGAVETYEDSDGHWVAMSRPPGPVWDRLPAKSMNGYINEHLRRVLR